MRFRIGSFNVKNLSDGEGRDLDRIARIINDNGLDIVCMQEVLQGGKILEGISLKDVSGQAKAYDRSLKRRLTGSWRSQWREPKLHREMEQFLGGDKRGEGYAILWKTDRLVLPRDKNGQEEQPKIFANANYNPAIAGSNLYMIRDPLYARFIIKNRPVELRILTTHIVYGKSNSAKDIVDYGAITMRKKEFEMLAGQIYYRVSEMYKVIDCTSPYTIMMGDYNLNLGTSLPFAVSFDKKGHVVSETDAHFTIHNLQNEKTTLSRDYPNLANSYDHFSMDTRTRDGIVSVESVQAFDAIHNTAKSEDKTEEELFNRYRKEVSDHLPIIMEVNL